MSLAAVKGVTALADSALLFDAYPTEITTWRSQLLYGAALVVGADRVTGSAEPAIDEKTLLAKISELTLAIDFCPLHSGAQAPDDPRGSSQGRGGMLPIAIR